jgi:thiamine-phosphate pyrophosphorylase
VILCSGNGLRICSEDILCGGILLRRLRGLWKEELPDDASRMALLLAEEFESDPYRLLKDCERGRELAESGYQQDLIDCSRVGISGTVPVFDNGRIVPPPGPGHSVPEAPFLYPILDRSVIPAENLACAAATLARGGADIIQYRGKGLSEEEKISDIRNILPVLDKCAVPLIVNDDPELARKTGAAGVHLGREDPDISRARELLGPGAVIGATVHSLGELDEVPAGLIDYISAGAVFRSATKPGVEVAGTYFLKKIRERSSLPLVAIGGINTGNAAEVFEAGADGIAVISSILTGDIRKNCFTFRRIIDRNIR